MNDLAQAARITGSRINLTDHILVEVGGSIKRMTVEELMNTINQGGEEVLREFAWGVPIKQGVQSSQNWGVVGNRDMYEAWKAQCGCYLLTFDGRAAKLSPTNSGVFADGTALDESKGNVVWIGPRVYYLVKVDESTGIPYLWKSMHPISKHYIGEANGGNHNVLGKYLGSIDGSGRLRSVSGAAVAGNKTITAFWNAAQLNGQRYGLENYDLWKLTVLINLAQYGNPNCQANLGYGPGGSADNWSKVQSIVTGATKALGDAFGVVDISATIGNADACHTSLMGIEDLWDRSWQFIQGVYFGKSGNAAQNGTEIFIYKGNRLPSAAELAATPEGEFRQLTRLTASGWMQEIICGEYFDIFPNKEGGSSASYWGDYHYANNTGQVLLVGGDAYNAAYAGVAYSVATHDWSDAYAYIGARLAYYGPITFVDGKDI